MSEWGPEQWQSGKVGHCGIVIPDQYVDFQFISANTRYPVGQTLKVRTPESVLPVRIAKYEVGYSDGSGRFYPCAIVEPIDGAIPSGSQRVIAGADFPDCSPSCALSRVKPGDDELRRIRAVAVDKLGVAFPSNVAAEYQIEMLVAYKGRFTRPDAEQYAAFFSRHGEGESGLGNWVAYVLDADFSLISVLDRDDYLRTVPDGVTDVDGDGLDELWSEDGGYEGSAYSLYHLDKTATPASFGRLKWPYFGL
jgi:hypothetical protein